MHIRLEVKTNSFISLYIKYVTGFNDELSGAKCLKGNYSSLTVYGSQKAGKVYEGALDEYVVPYIYIHVDTRLHRNDTNVALKHHDSQEVLYEDRNVSMLIKGAEQLEIPGIQDTMYSYWKAFNDEFKFGYHYLGEGVKR